MAKKKVLYIAQEIYPYVEGKIGEVSQLTPIGMHERGHDIRTFMPNYGVINERRNQLHEVIRLSGVNLTVNDHVHQLIVKVASMQPQRMQVYFIEDEDFYSRKGIFRDDKGELYEDNVERAVFFIRGVFETVKKLRWIPDIIHCQGWFTSLAPLYLKTLFKDDPALSHATLVFSAYDTTPDFPFGAQLTEVLAFDGIKDELLTGEPLEREALIELALKYLDGIVISTKEISDDLLNRIHQSGIKYLDYQEPEELVDSLEGFYSQLLEEV